MDTEQRAESLYTLLESALAQLNTPVEAAAPFLEQLLTSNNRAQFLLNAISDDWSRVHSTVASTITTELLSGRLPDFRDCIALTLSWLVMHQRETRARFEKSQDARLQRVTQILSGQVDLSWEGVIAEAVDELVLRPSRSHRFRTSCERVATDYVRRMMRSDQIDDEWLQCEFNNRQLPAVVSVDLKSYVKRATDYVRAYLSASETITEELMELQATRLWKRVNHLRRKSEAGWVESRYRTSDRLPSLFVRTLVRQTLCRRYRRRLYDD